MKAPAFECVFLQLLSKTSASSKPNLFIRASSGVEGLILMGSNKARATQSQEGILQKDGSTEKQMVRNIIVDNAKGKERLGDEGLEVSCFWGVSLQTWRMTRVGGHRHKLQRYTGQGKPLSIFETKNAKNFQTICLRQQEKQKPLYLQGCTSLTEVG